MEKGRTGRRDRSNTSNGPTNLAGVISCSLRHYGSRYRFILCFTMHTTAPPSHPSRHYCSITAAWSSYHFTPSVTPFRPFLAFPRLSAVTILVTARLHFVTKQI